MRLGKYLSGLTKPELNELKNFCNFTEEEGIIFEKLSKKKGITEISIELRMSESTVSRRILDIKKKVGRFNG